MAEDTKPAPPPKDRTCRTCGSALHSDLSRVMGQCGPCRVGEDQAAARDWGAPTAPSGKTE